MVSSPRPVFVPQIQRLQRGQILVSQAGEIVQELLQRLFSTLFELREAVEGIKWPGFAFFEDDPQARYPVGALADDQVAHDVERAPYRFLRCGAPRCRVVRVTAHSGMRECG